MLLDLFHTDALAACLPPNVNARQARSCIIGALTLCLAGGGITFIVQYSESYRGLFRFWGTSTQQLEAWSLMPNFSLYTGAIIWITAILAAMALASAAVLYSTYYQGSRSIYLMRRLPDGGKTLRRQVWSVPLRTALLVLLAGGLVLGLAYLVWRYVTPESCLPTEENVQRAMQVMVDNGKMILERRSTYD